MTTQVAVKLPDGAVAALDQLVASGSFTSRSDAIRYAVDALLRTNERRRIDDAFIEGFGRTPDTAEEVADATRLALDAIYDEPWERWW